jgi:hypothetical protein
LISSLKLGERIMKKAIMRRKAEAARVIELDSDPIELFESIGPSILEISLE